ncbi:MAG: amidohydrolase family protein, partial [Gammaproteobacteria bacterium]
MKKNTIRWLVALFACTLSTGISAQGFPFGPKPIKPADQVVIIHAGQLLAVPGEAPLSKHSVVIRNDTVTEVRAGYLSIDDIDTGGVPAEVIDLRQHFVLPGLMDSHVHLARATGAYSPGITQVNTYPAKGDATVNAMVNIRLHLNAGFTAVRDLGSDHESVFAVRDAINRGHLAGPTIIASGTSISVTGGHGDDSTSSDPAKKAVAGVCDGPAQCRTLTRHLEKTGADLIKIRITGGFSSNTGFKQQMTFEEMQAIINAAHLRGIPVTAHAYASDAIQDAIRAGIDAIEHGHLLDDETIAMMKDNDVFLIPTVIVANPPSMIKQFLGGRKPISVTLRDEYQSFEKAYKAGVKVAFGTDCGVYPHGENVDELVEMVRLGMTPADAVRSAT